MKINKRFRLMLVTNADLEDVIIEEMYLDEGDMNGRVRHAYLDGMESGVLELVERDPYYNQLMVEGSETVKEELRDLYAADSETLRDQLDGLAMWFEVETQDYFEEYEY